MENDEQYHNRVLIAKIWENYLSHKQFLFGAGIPKSQAFNAGERVPYDKESDIYYAMLNDLKACADGLKMDGDVYKADPIFSFRTEIQRFIEMEEVCQFTTFAFGRSYL